MAVEERKKLDEYLDNHKEWKAFKEEKRRCNYLFDYVSRIIDSDSSCRIYRYATPEDLPIYLFEHYERLALSEIPSVDEILFYVFETGVAFLELKISYGDMPVNEIINFAYYFKSSNRAEKTKYGKREGQKSLYEVTGDILPEEESGTKHFFVNRSRLKYQLMCFHMVKADYGNEFERNQLLFRLKRSYTESFVYEEGNDFGHYDMTYAPYEYMAFGGCQEGFAAVCHDTGIAGTDYFINEIFYNQLVSDYHYLYLVLLNQRFSEMKYIEEIACSEDTKELVEQISKKIIHLKTRYSFHVVSDDYIYQNIYSKMYEILDIDKLFLDIEENGDRLALVQNNDSVETEKENNRFLMCISLLAVFSALVDLASYLDRMSFATLVSTVVSAVGVLAVIGYSAFNIVRKRTKKNKKK